MTFPAIANSHSVWPKRTFATMIEDLKNLTSSPGSQTRQTLASALRSGIKAQARSQPKLAATSLANLIKALPVAKSSVTEHVALPVTPPVLMEAKTVTPPTVAAPPPVQAIKLAALEVPSTVRQKAVDLQRRQQLLIAKVNRTVPPGCHVLPWSILPKEIFEGEVGRFLMMACDFHVYGPENTMLLPAMPAGVQYSNLPRHPLVQSDVHTADAKRQVGMLRLKVNEEHARTTLALQKGDLTQMFKSVDRQALYRQELSRINRNIAVAKFGQRVWDLHEKRFRAQIQAL
jgi:hypothetical protein